MTKARPFLETIKEAETHLIESELAHKHFPSVQSAIRLLEADETLSALNEIAKDLVIDEEWNVMSSRLFNKRQRNRHITVLKNNKQ